LALEQATDLPAGGRVDQYLTGPSEALETGGEFGFSPIAVCWREPPEPIASPNTTAPVATPIRTCSGSPPASASVTGDGETGTDGAFRIGFPGLRPAEVDQNTVA
jgi:hypothetical protein